MPARSGKKTATSAAARPAKVVRAGSTNPPIDLGRALVEAFLTNERINQVLLDILDAKIWRTMPPCSKRRNIATTFAHVHNVRCMRLKMCGQQSLPDRLDRGEVTIAQAREALRQSAAATVALIEKGLANAGRVPNFRPDVVALVCTSINHDAHHRGQICHWASQLGSPLTPEQGLLMWEWDKRWKDVTAATS